VVLKIAAITLDVGLGTFQPIHEEESNNTRCTRSGTRFRSRRRKPSATRGAIPGLFLPWEHGGASPRRCRCEISRQRGTDSHDACPDFLVEPGRAEAGIFIKPGHRFAWSTSC